MSEKLDFRNVIIFREKLRECFDDLNLNIFQECLSYEQMIELAFWLCQDIKKEMDFKSSRFSIDVDSNFIESIIQGNF